MTNAEEVTGTRDEHYNLISVLYHTMQEYTWSAATPAGCPSPTKRSTASRRSRPSSISPGCTAIGRPFRRLCPRHYSTATLRRPLLEPSGLAEHARILYGERLPFYRLATRAPAALDWLRRPWDSLITLLVLRPVTEATKASAVLVDLRKPQARRDTSEQ